MFGTVRPFLLPGLLLLAGALGWLVSNMGMKAPLAVAFVPLLAALVMHPRWAFWLLIASIPVTIDFGSGLTVSRVVVPLVVTSIAIAVAVRRCPPIRPLRTPAGRAASLMLASIIISAVTMRLGGDWRLDAELANKDLTAYVTRFTLFFITLMMVREERDLRNALRVLVITGALEALVVLAQVHFRLALPGDWRFSAKLNIVDSEGTFRAEGTTAHPVYLAGYLQMVLPVALLLAAQARGFERGLYAASFGLMLYAWSAAYSRSSLLGLVAMAALAAVIWSRLGRIVVVACSTLLVLGLSAHGWSVTDFAQTLEELRHIGQEVHKDQLSPVASSLQFRLESSVGGLLLFLEHPWWGVGLGQARHHYVPLLPSWAISLFHPNAIHNAFLEVASELGIIGFVAFLAIWWHALRGVALAWNHPRLAATARVMALVLTGQATLLLMTPMVRDVWFSLALTAALGAVAQSEPATRAQA